jgi:hypothetical protein
VLATFPLEEPAMPVKPQSLENHVRFVPPYHLVLTLLLLVNLAYWVRVSLLGFTGLRLAGLCVAVGLFLLFFYARQFAVTVQDRVIRLEMRLRLERLLPADLAGRIGELATDQLVALRFAGDGELAGLTRRVLAGELRSRSQIKKEIKDWQADWLRA